MVLIGNAVGTTTQQPPRMQAPRGFATTRSSSGRTRLHDFPHPDARFPSKGGKVAAARRERGRIGAGLLVASESQNKRPGEPATIGIDTIRMIARTKPSSRASVEIMVPGAPRPRA